ncbi:hypothetical protein [Methanobacterium formicicum]|uniref:hypothetical protein n=1 Tax=Methanobacterium formicicum TaxID=2162 RepID=UPI0024121E87|nr:hypothetical protein [Methanobacterium formicicum]MDG3548139.1 hypothetical protein [Methanobacterium formicicum]
MSIESIAKELIEFAPYYVPELDLSEDMNVEIALIKIFAHMQKQVLDRLNKVPEKNLIAFLDTLGIKLLPAQPAIAPITFKLSEQNTEQILIPSRTQIAAGDVVFETEKNMLATPSKLTEAYTVDVAKDKIHKSPSNVVSGAEVIPFKAKILLDVKKEGKEIILNDLEGLKKEDMLLIQDRSERVDRSEYVIVSEVSKNIAKLSNNLEKPHKSNVAVEKVTNFELFEGKNLQEHILYLGHDNLFNTIGKVEIQLKIPEDFFKGDFLWEYCLKQDVETKEIEWKTFDEKDYDYDDDYLILKKNNPESVIGEAEIEGVKSRWIRCKFLKSEQNNVPDLYLDNIYVNIVNIEDLYPDKAFYNDVPLNVPLENIKPFGEIPKLFDTLYISSQEVFSKENARITLKIETNMISGGSPPPEPLLSWEYYDGETWSRIPGIEENFISNAPHDLVIKTLPEFKPLNVNGQENLWIRVRLIGGHYGKEVIITDGSVKNGKVTPPTIKSLSLNYDYTQNFQKLEQIVTFNNLEFKTEITPFKPFITSNDAHQTLYLGFDKKLEKGPISLFFSMDEFPWPVDSIPIIKWEYYAENDKWTILEVSDETGGFTNSGIVKFVIPPNFRKTKRFGKDLYWIRAIDIKDIFKPIKEIYPNQSPDVEDLIDSGDIPLYDATEYFFSKNSTYMAKQAFKVFHPEWSYPSEIKRRHLNPRITNILTNTTWAVQSESIKDEILGSSDGTKDQEFKLMRNPVILEEIWVNEIDSISEAEMNKITAKNEFETKEIFDETRKTEFWVKWNPVEDISYSSKDDRNYEIEKSSGELVFGDGIYGKIPPIGTNNIKANYNTGGGSKGNILVNEIKELKSSIAFVDMAYNPLAAGEGDNVETIEMAIKRGSTVLKHRNRAITPEDFQRITYQSSRAIARVKCIPNFDNQGNVKPGWVTILVIPHSNENKPKLSLQLKRQIENYLKEHSASVLNIQVSEPVYVEAQVKTLLVTSSMDIIPKVEKDAFNAINTFLHPIHGSRDNEGWKFGRIPHIPDFYSLLEKIEGLDYVKNLSITLKTHSNNKCSSEITLTPDTAVDLKLPNYTMIYSGIHEISVEATGGR